MINIFLSSGCSFNICHPWVHVHNLFSELLNNVRWTSDGLWRQKLWYETEANIEKADRLKNRYPFCCIVACMEWPRNYFADKKQLSFSFLKTVFVLAECSILIDFFVDFASTLVMLCISPFSCFHFVSTVA